MLTHVNMAEYHAHTIILLCRLASMKLAKVTRDFIFFSSFFYILLTFGFFSIQEYSTKQLISLVNCGTGSHFSKKAKQRLLIVIEETERFRTR